MKHVYTCLLAIMSILLSPSALAACTASSSTANLGALSSFTVASTETTTLSSTGLRCSGGVLTLIGTNTVDAAFATNSNALGTTPRLLNAATGTYLPYSICQDAACNEIVPLGSTMHWSETTLLGLLGLFSGPGGTLPLYLRPAIGMQLPRGTYTDTVTIQWHWKLCALGLLGLCVYDEGSATSTLTVTLEVLSDCFIDSAPDVSFGNAALVSAFQPVSQYIQVRCTPQATYRVGFDMGDHPSGNWRQMINGGNALQYNLYMPDTSQVWTDTNTLTQAGTGYAQSIPYRAIINPAQNNVPAGTYVDTVRVIVSY